MSRPTIILFLALSLALLPAYRSTRGQALRAGAAALGCPPEDATYDHPTSPAAATPTDGYGEQDQYTYRVRCGGRAVVVECQDPRTVDRATSRTRSACRAGKVSE